MYPNYSKTFLDLEDVLIRKVIQADSFLQIHIEHTLLNKPVLAVARKPDVSMITGFRKYKISPTLENRLLSF
mgnify:CR=1 FL=1